MQKREFGSKASNPVISARGVFLPNSSKKGISVIVVNVLLILIAIAAILILWQVVNMVVKTSASDVETSRVFVNMEVNRDSVKINQDTKQLRLNLKWISGEANVVKLDFVLENGTNSRVFEKDASGFGILQEKKFDIDFSGNLSNITKITIYPLILNEEGKEMRGLAIYAYMITGNEESVESVESVTSNEESIEFNLCQEKPVCNNIGGVQCKGYMGNITQYCYHDVSNNCNYWGDNQTCSAGFKCQEGNCVAISCDVCVAGNKRCSGNQVENCIGVNGCLNWRVTQTCSAGFFCNNGGCSPTPDTTPPSLVLVSPQNITYATGRVLIQIDASPDAANVWWSNGLGYVYTGVVEHSFNNGRYTLYAYANDSSGNVNVTSVSFNVQIDVPDNYSLEYLNYFDFNETDYVSGYSGSKYLSIDTDDSGNIYVAGINDDFLREPFGDIENTMFIVKLNSSLSVIGIKNISSLPGFAFNSPIKLKYNNDRAYVALNRKPGSFMISSNISWDYFIFNASDLSLISSEDKGLGMVFGFEFDEDTPVFGIYNYTYELYSYDESYDVSVWRDSIKLFEISRLSNGYSYDYLFPADIYVRDGKAYLAAWNRDNYGRVRIYTSKEGAWNDRIYDTGQSSNGYDSVEDILVDRNGNIYVGYFVHHPSNILQLDSSENYVNMLADGGGSGGYALINSVLEFNEFDQVFITGEEYTYNNTFTPYNVSYYNINPLSYMGYVGSGGADMAYDFNRKRLIVIDDEHHGGHDLSIKVYKPNYS